MAVIAKSFRHTTAEATDKDNSVAGLAKDVEDYVNANSGTIDATSNIVISQTSVGAYIYTLVMFEPS